MTWRFLHSEESYNDYLKLPASVKTSLDRLEKGLRNNPKGQGKALEHDLHELWKYPFSGGGKNYRALANSKMNTVDKLIPLVGIFEVPTGDDKSTELYNSVRLRLKNPRDYSYLEDFPWAQLLTGKQK